MMSLLATLLAPLGIGGAIWRWIAIPGVILSALTFGHIAWQKRDARILAEGERICTARYEAAIREEERSAAQRALWAERQLLEAERLTAKGLEDELDRIRKANAELAKAAVAADDHCLSPGVLDAIRSGKAGRNAKNRPAGK